MHFQTDTRTLHFRFLFPLIGKRDGGEEDVLVLLEGFFFPFQVSLQVSDPNDPAAADRLW